MSAGGTRITRVRVVCVCVCVTKLISLPCYFFVMHCTQPTLNRSYGSPLLIFFYAWSSRASFKTIGYGVSSVFFLSLPLCGVERPSPRRRGGPDYLGVRDELRVSCCTHSKQGTLKRRKEDHRYLVRRGCCSTCFAGRGPRAHDVLPLLDVSTWGKQTLSPGRCDLSCKGPSKRYCTPRNCFLGVKFFLSLQVLLSTRNSARLGPV